MIVKCVNFKSTQLERMKLNIFELCTKRWSASYVSANLNPTVGVFQNSSVQFIASFCQIVSSYVIRYKRSYVASYRQDKKKKVSYSKFSVFYDIFGIICKQNCTALSRTTFLSSLIMPSAILSCSEVEKKTSSGCAEGEIQNVRLFPISWQ